MQCYKCQTAFIAAVMHYSKEKKQRHETSMTGKF